MKTHSCGAILYTVCNSKVYVILGKEFNDWFPFKGKCEPDETFEEAAIREIEEETCRVVRPARVALECEYATSRKFYHIGLVFVPHTFIDEFYMNRRRAEDKKYLEKTDVKMFPIERVNDYRFPQVTSVPVKHYYLFLSQLQNKINTLRSMLGMRSKVY